jgi:hypothetical protein
MRRLLILAAATALLTGCGREPVSGLDDDRFVDVVVLLRRAAAEHHADPAAFVERRDEILRDAGTTEAEVREYVERHGRDLQHMADIWAAINRRLTEEEEYSEEGQEYSEEEQE